MISLNLFSSLRWTSCLVFVQIIIYGIGLATFLIQFLTKKRWQVFPDPTKVFSNFKETLQNKVPKILLSGQSGVGRIIAAPYALTTANFQIFLGVLASLMYFSSFFDKLCSYYQGNNCLVANDHKLCFMFKHRCQHDQTKLFLWTNFAFIQLLVSFATTLVVGPCIDAIFKKLGAHISLQVSKDFDDKRMVGLGTDDLGAVSGVLADAMLRAVNRMESECVTFGQSNTAPQPVASNRALLGGARDGPSEGEAAIQRLLSFTDDDDPDGVEVKDAWSSAVFNTFSKSHHTRQQQLDRLTATLSPALTPTAPERRVTPHTQPAASPPRENIPGSIGHLLPLSGVGKRALMVAFVADLLGPGTRAARAYTALAHHHHLCPTLPPPPSFAASTSRPSCCRVWLIIWIGVIVALNIILTLVTFLLALDPTRLRLPQLSQSNGKGWRVLLAVGIALVLELLVQGVSWLWLNRCVPGVLAAALDLVRREIEAEAEHLDQLHELTKGKEEGPRALSALLSPQVNRAVARRGMRAPRRGFFVSAAAAHYLLQLWLYRDRAHDPVHVEGDEEVNIPPEVVLIASYSSFFPYPLFPPSREEPSPAQSPPTQGPPTPSLSLDTLLHTPYSKSRGVFRWMFGAVRSMVMASWLYGLVLRVSVLGVAWQVFWIRVCVLGMVLVLVLAWGRGWVSGIVVTTYSALYGLTLVHQCIRTVIEIRHELENGRRWQAAVAARLTDKQLLRTALSEGKDKDDPLDEKQVQCPPLDDGDKNNKDRQLVSIPTGAGLGPGTGIGIGTGTSPSTAASRKTSFSSHLNKDPPDIAAGGGINNKEWPVSGPRSVGPPLVLIPEMRSIGIQTSHVRSLAVQTAWSDEGQGQGRHGSVSPQRQGGDEGVSGGGVGYRSLQSMDFPRPFHDDAKSTDNLHAVANHNENSIDHVGVYHHHHHQNQQQHRHGHHPFNGNVNALDHRGPSEAPKASLQLLHSKMEQAKVSRSQQHDQSRDGLSHYPHHGTYTPTPTTTPHIPRSHETDEWRESPCRDDFVSRVDELHRGRVAELAKWERLHAEGRSSDSRHEQRVHHTNAAFDAAMGALIDQTYDEHQEGIRAYPGGTRAQPGDERAHSDPKGIYNTPIRPTHPAIITSSASPSTHADVVTTSHSLKTGPGKLQVDPTPTNDHNGDNCVDGVDDDDNGREQQRLRDEAWKRMEEDILIEVCSQIDTMPSPIRPVAGLSAHTAFERALLRAQRRRQVLRARALRDAFARDAEQRYADSLSPRTIKKLVHRYYLHQVGTFDIDAGLGVNEEYEDEDEDDEDYIPSSVHAVSQAQQGGGGRGGGGRGDVNYVRPQETRERFPLHRDGGGRGGGGRSEGPHNIKGATAGKAPIPSGPPNAKSPQKVVGDDSDIGSRGSPSPKKKVASSPSLLASSNSIGKSVGKAIGKGKDIGKDVGVKKGLQSQGQGQGQGKMIDQSVARSRVEDKAALMVDSSIPQGSALLHAQKQEQVQLAAPVPSTAESSSTKEDGKDTSNDKGKEDNGNGNGNDKGKDKGDSVFERLYSKRKRHEEAKAEPTPTAKEKKQTSASPAKKEPFWLRLSSTRKERDIGCGNGIDNYKGQGTAPGAGTGKGTGSGAVVGLNPPGNQDGAKAPPISTTGSTEVTSSGGGDDDGGIPAKAHFLRQIDPVQHESEAAEGNTWGLRLHSAVKRMATDMVKNITTISDHK